MGKPVAEAQPKPPPAPLSTLVFGDFMCTSLWVVASSCFAEVCLICLKPLSAWGGQAHGG